MGWAGLSWACLIAIGIGRGLRGDMSPSPSLLEICGRKVSKRILRGRVSLRAKACSWISVETNLLFGGLREALRYHSHWLHILWGSVVVGGWTQPGLEVGALQGGGDLRRVSLDLSTGLLSYSSLRNPDCSAERRNPRIWAPKWQTIISHCNMDWSMKKRARYASLVKPTPSSFFNNSSHLRPKSSC